jgi:hypothetical protein
MTLSKIGRIAMILSFLAVVGGWELVDANPAAAISLPGCDPSKEAPYCSDPTTTFSIFGRPCSDSASVIHTVYGPDGAVNLLYSSECRAVWALNTDGNSQVGISTHTSSDPNSSTVDYSGRNSPLFHSGSWTWTVMLNDANVFGVACVGNFSHTVNTCTNPGY